MAPIRVGFLGLSTTGWAAGAHLPYLKESDKYQIVAICNSSVESSRKAIELYELPESTKAYGDSEELAKDREIDLVVCSVRVDRHYETISPSLRAGKDVYVEYPLGKSLADAKKLLQLKNEHGVKKAVVGLQARQSPVLKKVKELIASGRLGKVLSSVWTGQAHHLGGSSPEALSYFLRREVGGNLVTIHFGHAVDFVQFVHLLSAEGKVIEEKYPNDTHDTIFLNGTLSSGIPLSMTLRGGVPFKDTPGMDWRIYGETGEIRITASGPFVQIGYEDLKIHIHELEKDTVEEILPEKDAFDEKFATPARNVARLYEGFAQGEINCSFEDAVERHALIEGMYKENGIQE